MSSSARLKLGDAALADGDGLDHRHAELCFEPLRIELEAVALGEIDHVERDDRRQPELDQLQREAEMIVEVGRVDDDEQARRAGARPSGGRAARRA